jgi:hypothetical protein
LSGPAGDFHFNIFGWEQALKLAELYGWEPAGTEAPKRDDPDEAEDPEDEEWEEVERVWGGGYCTNDGQWVSSEDAENLADALESALPDIPGHDALENKTREIMTKEGPMRVIPAGADVNPLESFSGPTQKAYLRKFIEFCRAGGFNIW